MGIIFDSQDNAGATDLFIAALDKSEYALNAAALYLDLSIEWDSLVDRELKNTVAWLYAHLGRTDRLNRAYELVSSLKESIRGQEEEAWWIRDTCNYVLFKLPRYQDDPQKARESMQMLLSRNDIPDTEKALWRRLYGLT